MDHHQRLRPRFIPLHAVEGDLKRLLGIEAEDIPGSFQTTKRDGVSSQEVKKVILNCKDDTLALWLDDLMMRRYGVRLEDPASLSVLFPALIPPLMGRLFEAYFDPMAS